MKTEGGTQRPLSGLTESSRLIDEKEDWERFPQEENWGGGVI